MDFVEKLQKRENGDWLKLSSKKNREYIKSIEETLIKTVNHLEELRNDSLQAFMKIGAMVFDLNEHVTKFINANMKTTNLNFEEPEELVECLKIGSELMEKLGLKFNFESGKPIFVINLESVLA